jgi:hypothetical protein
MASERESSLCREHAPQRSLQDKRPNGHEEPSGYVAVLVSGGFSHQQLTAHKLGPFAGQAQAEQLFGGEDSV